jgi:phosphoglycolate phosphatase-like HAD superfamily hydrolase
VLDANEAFENHYERAVRAGAVAPLPGASAEELQAAGATHVLTSIADLPALVTRP